MQNWFTGSVACTAALANSSRLSGVSDESDDDADPPHAVRINTGTISRAPRNLMSPTVPSPPDSGPLPWNSNPSTRVPEAHDHEAVVPEKYGDDTGGGDPLARPSLLTPERQAVIVEWTAEGNRVENAAAAAGVNAATFHNWMARGRVERDRLARTPKGKPRASEVRYLEFLEAIEKARAEALATAIGEIRKAGQRDWKALAWWAERTYPELYGRPWRPQGDKESDGKGAIVKAIEGAVDTPRLPGE